MIRRAALLLLALGAAFVANGVWPSWRTPDFGVVGAPSEAGRTIRILAFNIAKCEAYGGAGFNSAEHVRRCLDGVAALVREVGADLVFLNEIAGECGPCGPDQPEHLARAAGLHAYAYGTNFSFGVPGFRIRAGNALLSRFPLRPLEVEQLPGGAPFYAPTNNRRILWVEVDFGDERLRAGSLRNDSYSLANNRVQAEHILSRRDPMLLAGDFNADPTDASMRAFAESARFSGAFDGPPTHPTGAPARTIDFVLAPAEWRLVEHRVIDSDLSDHLPVLSIFERPER